MGLHREQTILEEVFNGVTCGVGLCLSVAALVVLVVSASLIGDAWRVASVSIYGTSLVLLFLSSTLYHCVSHKKAKRIFEILDHCAIYLLIAGTYTPFTLVTLRGPWGWTLFGIVWGLAIFGILSKTFFIERFRFLSTFIYLLMGWLIVIALQPLVRNLLPGGTAWLLAGGVIYSAGTLFYARQKLSFHHTLWHFFVLGGCACHFFSVLFYVVYA